MESHFKGLDADATSSSSLDSTDHRLTPTPISSIVVSILFDLITIMYYSMSCSIDDTSDEIWKGGISDMGNLYSKMKLQ